MNFASQNKYFVRVSMQVRVTAQLNAHCNIIEVVNPKDRCAVLQKCASVLMILVLTTVEK